MRFAGVMQFLFVALASGCSQGQSNVVDLSKPFVCKDISANSISIDGQAITIDGVRYKMVVPNASSRPNLTNTIFTSSDERVEIDLFQQRDTGVISVSFIKYKLPSSNIPLGSNPDGYKEYEIVTDDLSEYTDRQPYLKGNGLGCSNI